MLQLWFISIHHTIELLLRVRSTHPLREIGHYAQETVLMPNRLSRCLCCDRPWKLGRLGPTSLPETE